jgi:hypothetical protein
VDFYLLQWGNRSHSLFLSMNEFCDPTSK